jgi:hypothetical protein
MTWHEDAAMRAAQEFMTKPHGGEAIGVYYQGLAEGRWDNNFLDVVGQSDARRGTWDVGQVYSFAQFHTAWISGEYAACYVPVGGTPGPDADRAGNAALAAVAREPFVIEVDQQQNNADQDGRVSWSEALRMTAFVPDQELIDGQDAKVYDVKVGPQSIPLEIGTTLPSRTWLHMQRDGGVVRWPYGQDRLTVFVRLRRGSILDLPMFDEVRSSLIASPRQPTG